jgi:hypothetical protein
MSLLANDNLCPCFAIELILRRDHATEIKVTIIGGLERSAAEKQQFPAY